MIDDANAVRKHAQPFMATFRKAGCDLDSFQPHVLTWQDLCRVERDARSTAATIIEKVTNSTPDERAAEMEAAYDALTIIAADCAKDKDARNERGDREPWAGVDLDRRPKFENRSAPCGDYGHIEQAPEAFALRNGQPMRNWATALDHNHETVSAGAYLRALTAGPKNDAERRALGGGTDAAGGYTVPTLTSAELIDLARAEMVLSQAGARVVPLSSDQNVIAKVLTDPVPAWRAENAAVNESDPTFGSVTLAPKSIAVMVKASVELMQDSLNLEAELPRILARALAAEIDRAGLIGSGSGNEPLGITHFTSLTANTYAGGALTSYAPIMTARGALHGANESMGAVIMATRDENTLASLTATDGQPLNMPQVLSGLPMLHTTAVPTDGGDGSDESKIIAGDFSQLLMGIRSEVRIEILRERFMDSLQFGLIAHARVDFAVAREGAFTVLDGVTG